MNGLIPQLVYLCLGSNLGDRAAQLSKAIDQLKGESIHLLRLSGLYETEPQNQPDQPWFLNQVAECETTLSPAQLLKCLHRIEHLGGRVHIAGRRWGPRKIDIDILLYADQVIHSKSLTVPHARLLERRFVLEPLLELSPGLVHPETRLPLTQYLPGVANQQLRAFTLR